MATKLWNPSDLAALDAHAVMRELFDETPENWWWRIERPNQKFKWVDRRLNLETDVSPGFLVALHEVSNKAQALEFAKKNRLTLFADGGLHFRGTAEVFLRCNGLPPAGEMTEDDQYIVRTTNGSTATLGYASMLFRRLVLRPAGEEIQSLPDPALHATLAFDCDKGDVHKAAELALFHLRREFPTITFSFQTLAAAAVAPPLEPARPLPGKPREKADLQEPKHPEALAFYNRALEAEPIQAFLYFYRVLEACFDDVLDAEVASWRSDGSLTGPAMLRKVRKLHQREDHWSLRQIIGKIATQPRLDHARGKGLLPRADADTLVERIYLRRNSIAHGRRGAHDEVLVPYCFAPAMDGSHQDWRDLMQSLAEEALKVWVLVA